MIISTGLLQLDKIDKFVNKSVKLTTCNKSVAFLAVYSITNIIFFSLLDSDWLKTVPINP